MIFHSYPPAKILSPFVRCYLEADSRNSTEKGVHPLFPNGLSGIFFNFGSLGKLSIKEEYETPEVSIFGQIDRCFDAIHWPGSYSLGVLLKPSVLSKFLKEDMSKLTNKAVDGQLFRPELREVHRQLKATSSVKKKITILNRHFIKTFSYLRHQPPTLAERAIDQIYHHPSLSIKKLAHHLKVSERYLQVQFKKSVGLSPKTYSLIIRFMRMEQQLFEKSAVRWEDMNFASEYYDQNHFIKDFKRFTGITPSGYLLKNFEMGRSYLLR
jgi:AraC-like DNA-binding protein